MEYQDNPGGGGIGSLLMLLGFGGIAYYGYTQGWFNSFLGASSPQVGQNLATGTPSTGSTGTPGNATSAPASWSGPSLDTMFANLLAAEQAAIMASVPDPALSCPGAAVTAAPLPVNGGGSIATNPNAPRTANGQPTGTIVGTPAALSGFGASGCLNPVATYDVHNWYLVNRANSGIVSAPANSDHTTEISLSDYWVWAAPLLQASNPGLSGGFGRGLGAYAELGRIVQIEKQRRGEW